MTSRCAPFSAGHALRAWGALGLLWAFAWTAHADGAQSLEQGKRLSRQLELEAALASFQRALDGHDLTRAQLIQLLAERAFVYHALADSAALVEDFVWLSALEPDYRLDLRAPPDLRAIWTATRDQGRGQLRITLHAERRESGEVLAHAALTGTVPRGAAARLFMRAGSEPFRPLPEPKLHELAADGAAREFYAEAVGLGGVVIASAHGPDQPLRIEPSAPPAPAPKPLPAPAPEPPVARDDGHRRRVRNWTLGAVSLLLGAGVVTTVLALRAREQEPEQPRLKPVVSF
jgi:hypothetical protein